MFLLLRDSDLDDYLFSSLRDTDRLTFSTRKAQGLFYVLATMSVGYDVVQLASHSIVGSGRSAD